MHGVVRDVWCVCMARLWLERRVHNDGEGIAYCIVDDTGCAAAVAAACMNTLLVMLYHCDSTGCLKRWLKFVTSIQEDIGLRGLTCIQGLGFLTPCNWLLRFDRRLAT
jgi:hypothetical protein